MNSVTLLLIGVFAAGMILGLSALIWGWFRIRRLRQNPRPRP